MTQQETRADTGYVIPSDEGPPFGRLHLSVKPAFRISDERPKLVLTLTARGRPLDDKMEVVVSALDLGHDWVVRGFSSMTTPEMHGDSGRTDVYRQGSIVACSGPVPLGFRV